MQLALTVLQIVAPVLLVGGAGWVWVRAGREFPVAFITRLCFDIAVPCLLFTALVNSGVEPSAIGRVALAAVAAHVVGGAALWALLKVWRLPIRAFLPPMLFGNTGNVGMPVAYFGWGEEGLVIAAAIFAVTAMLFFTIGVLVASGGARPSEAARQPIFYAAAAGFLFAAMGWRPPEFLMNALGLMGQMAIPLMLLTLGSAVARLSVAGAGRALSLSLSRLVLLAGATWAALALFPAEGAARDVLVMQMLTPVAVTAYLVAERYDARPAEVAGLVVVSTIVAIFAIPALLAVLVG